MKQRTALIVSAMLTAFILVIAGGVAASLMQSNAGAEPALASTTTPPQTPAPAQQPDPAVSAAQATKIAGDTVTGATLQQDPELVNFQGRVAYEVLLDQGAVYVDANSGQVLHNGTVVASGGNGPVDRAQAIQIAGDYLGGGTVEEAELENDDGVTAYEVEFTNGSKVYVDTATGEVIYARVNEHNRYDDHDEDADHGREYDDDHDEYEDYDD